jgi:hypothetical protein
MGRGNPAFWNRTTSDWAPYSEGLKLPVELHERGHARAFWEKVKPCLERDCARFEGLPIGPSERSEINNIATACDRKLDHINLSIKYANKGQRDGYKQLGMKLVYPNAESDIGSSSRQSRTDYWDDNDTSFGTFTTWWTEKWSL